MPFSCCLTINDSPGNPRMESTSLCINTVVFPILIHVLLLSSQASSLPSQSPTLTNFITSLSDSNNSTDQDALLAFKSLISDRSSKALDTWNTSIHFCQWQGVTCGGNKHPMRVTSLDLESFNLSGTISPHIANLSFLRRLHLPLNNFYGSIPQELSNLHQLRYINFSFNSLTGEIPQLSHCSNLHTISLDNNILEGVISSNLSLCFSLQTISLSNNQLTGKIPEEFGSLPMLETLTLAINNLTGGIPPSLGNLSTLTYLYLSKNNLSGGIPPSLGKLSSLTYLALTHNELSGTIPSTLYNLSNIYYFSVGDNQLVGSLPPDIGTTLPNLQYLSVYRNQFFGSIPLSLANASKIYILELSQNKFSGKIPFNLGNLKGLVFLALHSNKLEAKEVSDWNFLTSLTNCSRLQVLELSNNMLGSILPISIVNLSTRLEWLFIHGNQISGSIPTDLGNLIKLNGLFMHQNLLTGTIPDTIGKLWELQELALSGNKFSGRIPDLIGNLTRMNRLELGQNDLEGSIPQGFGSLQSLEELNLSHNHLTGPIPKEIVNLSSMSILLDLSHNSLTGSIPTEVDSLKNLNIFDVSWNKLSGEIPQALGECQVLQQLAMGGNFLQGTIPLSLSKLKGIEYIDLSCNNFSGKIPVFLENFRILDYLNLSFNNFEGEVPTQGVFRNINAFSVLGNDKLCGGNPKLYLPTCYVPANKKKHLGVKAIVIISVVSIFSCFALLFYLFSTRYLKHSSTKEDLSFTSWKDQYMMISYADLLKATDGFSSANLIGVGSFGSVYKGFIGDGKKAVAVKVLNLKESGALRSFMAECEALRNTRHRNLIKIITLCSSVDFKGNDFKALVYEFMANGSLDNWLHPELNEQFGLRKLTLIQRLNIAIDVASALDYLHHHGSTAIVHCDIKPSNILLDDDLTAHIGDFGLARFLNNDMLSQNSTSSAIIKGSIGYVAPEYGLCNEASTYGDVYSYGILLLVMFSGRSPTDDAFKEGLNLHTFVEMAFPDSITDIVDRHLFIEENGGEISNSTQSIRLFKEEYLDCINSVFRIGILCSKESPSERLPMRDVVREMHAVRDAFF